MTQLPLAHYLALGHTEEEAGLLMEHDALEELHNYRHTSTEDDYDFCADCGDTEEGLMHANTWRNVEPLSDLYYHAEGY